MAKLSDFKSKNEEQKKDRDVSEIDLQNIYNHYKDMSQDDLSKELFSEVARQKSQGTFDYNRLNFMIDSIRPSLTNEQYENMKRMLDSLKWNITK